MHELPDSNHHLLSSHVKSFEVATQKCEGRNLLGRRKVFQSSWPQSGTYPWLQSKCFSENLETWTILVWKIWYDAYIHIRKTGTKHSWLLAADLLTYHILFGGDEHPFTSYLRCLPPGNFSLFNKAKMHHGSAALPEHQPAEWCPIWAAKLGHQLVQVSTWVCWGKCGGYYTTHGYGWMDRMMIKQGILA